ncbi:MAG: DHHA1 domain-containing protein, partial [candidate division KSB1 bacterium]|nr:DHHA1 domain-containing protein [candidate division KSB1 bacterium]
IIHIARGFLPEPLPMNQVKARVKRDQRMSTARNHTATHLLQAALRQVLGKHVQQSGSLVTPFRLRFDLTHFERIAPEQLKQIERIVNEKIRENIPLQIFYSSYDEARKQGAMALFGEKYGDRVRVIKIDDFSMELCGGTHVTATGQIGMFRIVSESSVAAGIRRIEAITGEEAYRRSLEDREIIESLSETLNAPAPELSERVRQLIEQNKSLEKELQQLRVQSSNVTVDEWIKHAQPIANFSLVVKAVQLNSVDQLKEMGDILRDRLKSGVGVLGMVLDGKINFLCVITDDLIKQKNLKAGDIVKEIAAIAGGSGGGRPHMALAGAKDLSKFELALAEVENIIRKKM